MGLSGPIIIRCKIPQVFLSVTRKIASQLPWLGGIFQVGSFQRVKDENGLKCAQVHVLPFGLTCWSRLGLCWRNIVEHQSFPMRWSNMLEHVLDVGLPPALRSWCWHLGASWFVTVTTSMQRCCGWVDRNNRSPGTWSWQAFDTWNRLGNQKGTEMFRIRCDNAPAFKKQ